MVLMNKKIVKCSSLVGVCGSVLLAAPAKNRCSALVCSCYVPSKNFAENNRTSNYLYNSKQPEKRDSNNSIGSHEVETTPGVRLKSSLKKTTTSMEAKAATEKKNVTWSDAHGKDIAHILEFEPSSSEDGELGGVRNSCVCAIQ